MLNGQTSDPKVASPRREVSVKIRRSSAIRPALRISSFDQVDQWLPALVTGTDTSPHGGPGLSIVTDAKVVETPGLGRIAD
jgi:hypothetical protein